MSADTLQFRDYIFPRNPRRITVTEAADIARLTCPGRGEAVQQLGRGARVVRCEGSFLGDSFGGAVAELEAFRRAAGRDTPGTLLLPGIPPFAAHLQEFVYEAVGDGRIIPYTMLFVEAEAVT